MFVPTRNCMKDKMAVSGVGLGSTHVAQTEALPLTGNYRTALMQVLCKMVAFSKSATITVCYAEES